MEKMTKKQKIIAGLTVGALALTIGVIALTTSFGSDSNNAPEQIEVTQKNNLELVLGYREEPKDEYIIISDGEKIVIQNSDITPEIDTTKIERTEYEVEVDGETVGLIVIVEDDRVLTLESLNENEKVKVRSGELTVEELEELIIEKLTVKVNGEEEIAEEDTVEFTFGYPTDFDTELETEGEYKITVTARFEDHTKNNAKHSVDLLVEKPEEVVVDDTATEDETPAVTNSSGSSEGDSAKSGSSGSSASGGSSSSGSSSGSSSTPKPAPKPEPKPEPAPAPKPEPAPKPAPSKPAPSGVPGTKVSGDSHSDVYNANISLSGGASIYEYVVDYGSAEVVLFIGIDNSGQHFGIEYDRAYTTFIFSEPDLTDAQLSKLREYGNQILSAYGM